MAFQTLAFLGFLALTVLLCHALGRARPSLGRAALLDTMKDLIVDALGALVIAVIGYFPLRWPKDRP